MAREFSILDWSFPANTDLSSYQYYAVSLSSGKLILGTGPTVKAFILQDKPNAENVMGTVRLLGISKAKLGGTVTAGNRLCSHTDGTLIAVTGATDRVVATALQSGVAADIIEVLCVPGFTYAAATD